MARFDLATSNTNGKNERLRALHRADLYAYREFSYLVLRTLPKSFTASEVIECESFYETKLGTRAVGLNAN